jgi:GT2 family glycosyltransferase
MDVSIILVNYNTKQLTIDCLESIYEKTSGVDFEVFVVDNASQEDSIESIKEAFPQVKLIKNPENIGFGRANNVGIKKSVGRYVFLLNTDTVLINNAVKVLFDFMEENPEVGACGGNLFDADREPVHSFGYLKTPIDHLMRFSGFRYFYKCKKNDVNRGKLRQVEQIIGADLMLRKSVLDEVGIFDERFFLYFEESELQYRIQKAGHKIFYVPDAFIFHFEGGSSKKNKNFRRQIITQSEYLYFSLCYDSYPKNVLRILCSIPQIYRFVYSPVNTFYALKYIWSN